MKKIIYLAALLLPLTLLSQVPARPFTINAKLDGFAEGTKVSLYQNGQQTEWLSTTIKQGKFSFKEKLAEPSLCFIVVDGVQKPIEVFTEPAVITIKGKKDAMDKVEITGSKSHKDFAEFVAAFLPKAQHMNALSNSLNQSPPGAERDAVMTTYTSVSQAMQQVIDNFIKSHPGSYVSAFILSITYGFNEDLAVLEARFAKLSESIRGSESGKELKEFIEEKKIGSVGSMAIDFTQEDTTGTPVSLSSFRGKYVLVDFWASWCGPCRGENPNVVENYNKFRNKNFTVLGVSLDRQGQKDKWMAAIREDGLTWTHVSDLQFWNNAAAKLYHISSIPQNFLVDPSGKIVARNLRGPALEEKLCELLGCN